MDWSVWRPILAQVTTLREIEEWWSVNDLLDAHEALDVQAEMQEQAQKGQSG